MSTRPKEIIGYLIVEKAPDKLRSLFIGKLIPYTQIEDKYGGKRGYWIQVCNLSKENTDLVCKFDKSEGKGSTTIGFEFMDDEVFLGTSEEYKLHSTIEDLNKEILNA